MSNCLLAGKKTCKGWNNVINFLLNTSLQGFHYSFFKCGNKIAILSRWWTEHYCLELLRLHDVLHIFFSCLCNSQRIGYDKLWAEPSYVIIFFSFKKQTLYKIEISFWFILRSFFEGKVLDITKSSSYISFSVKGRVL